MKTLSRLMLLAALTVIAACGGVAQASSPVALKPCIARQPEVALNWGPVRGVAGAFAVTAKDLAEWQETRDASRGIRPASVWRNVPPDLALNVCYYDGDFNNFPGRDKRPAYDRIAVIIGADGRLTLDSAGPHDNLRVERPKRK
jgi:hypothetical protein